MEVAELGLAAKTVQTVLYSKMYDRLIGPNERPPSVSWAISMNHSVIERHGDVCNELVVFFRCTWPRAEMSGSLGQYSLVFDGWLICMRLFRNARMGCRWELRPNMQQNDRGEIGYATLSRSGGEAVYGLRSCSGVGVCALMLW